MKNSFTAEFGRKNNKRKLCLVRSLIRTFKQRYFEIQSFCVNVFPVRSFSGSYFLTFRLKKEIYRENRDTAKYGQEKLWQQRLFMWWMFNMRVTIRRVKHQRRCHTWTETFVRRFSSKLVFFKILQISQEITFYAF